LSFCAFRLAIVLSVLLRFTDYDYPFGIFKLFLKMVSGTRRVNLVTNPVISHEWWKDREVVTTSGTYPWSFVKQIFHSGQNQVMVATVNYLLSSYLSILISLLVFPSYYIWLRTNCDMRFINLTRKVARWTCSSVRGSNEPSNPIRYNVKHIGNHNSKDRVTRTPLKTGGELKCSGRVSSSSSTSGTRRVNLVTNPVISHEWWKDREVGWLPKFASKTTSDWLRFKMSANQIYRY
jgi:hypothetical protein